MSPLKKKAREKDLDFEIRFYEGILARKGDFVQALIALGDLYTRKGWWEKGLSIDQKLSLLRPDDPIILYNLACSYSLLNRLDEAYKAIKEAVRCGYDDIAYMLEDPDLDNLRHDARFQRYLTRLRRKNKSSTVNE